MSKAAVCPHCGGSDIDNDQSRGNAVCVSCGSVIEDNFIVSEVNFQENSLGGTSVIGQFVSSEGKTANTLGGNFRTGVGKESRQITLQKGKDRVNHIGNQLNLNNHCLGVAYNFFKMAVQKKLTRGRRTDHIVAACVYLACRVESTPHMLLDLSDLLQVNVFVLGKTYMKLSTELHIHTPAVDPCLYITRFAHKLEFGEKTHTVSMTALRLVSRMKRDWMHTGRRPSGLCGAALLVAARLHNFNRTQKEIIKVVKVCDATLRKRLTEFEKTPSGQLTVDEFNKIDLEEEQDPPSFTKARRNAKIAQLEELDRKQMLELEGEVSTVQIAIEKALHQKRKQMAYDQFSESSVGEDDEDIDEAEIPDNEVDGEDVVVAAEIDNDNLTPGSSTQEDRPGHKSPEHQTPVPGAPETPKTNDGVLDELLMPPPWASDGRTPRGLRPSPLSLGLRRSIEECMKPPEQPATEKEKEDDSGELDLTGIDDDDLDKLILNEREVEVKTKIWMLENAEFYKQMKKKEALEEKERENMSKQDQKKYKRKATKKKPTETANTAGEAIEKLLKEKKISSKINYDVLKNLESPSQEARVPSEMAAPVEQKLINPYSHPVTVIEDESTKRPLEVVIEDTIAQPPRKKRAPAPKPLAMPSVGEPSAPVTQEVVIETGPIQQHDEEEGDEDIYFNDDDIDDYEEFL